MDAMLASLSRDRRVIPLEESLRVSEPSESHSMLEMFEDLDRNANAQLTSTSIRSLDSRRERWVGSPSAGPSFRRPFSQPQNTLESSHDAKEFRDA
jgi:hypothetical protein